MAEAPEPHPDAPPTNPDRGSFAVAMAGLAGGLAGAIAGGLLGGLGWAATHPNPEGLAGLAVIVVAMLAAGVGSYPGAVLGVWLAVRGRPGARATVLWTLALYPLVALAPFLAVSGFAGVSDEAALLLGDPRRIGACAAARALALRRGDATEGGAR